MVKEYSMDLFHMNGGEGDKSYAMNSYVQSKILLIAKPIVEDAFQDHYISNTDAKGRWNGKRKAFTIADLGCATGPNSLTMISHVVNMVSNKLKEFDDHDVPEFQIFLNDLPGNDFNSVFQSLPTNVLSSKQIFIAASPGSFYERLFPSNSVDFFHSSASVHWLSQAPPELGCLNKGKIFISKESPEIVLSAYQTQFKRDFSRFLHLRGMEMVDGGQMVLVMIGRRPKYLPTNEENNFYIELLANVLMEMATKGLLEKEKIDSFNLPFYPPSMEEVEEIVQSEGSFQIKHIEILHVNLDNNEDGGCSRGSKLAKVVQAFLESMLAAHFGESIIQPLFVGLEKLFDEYLIKKNVIYNLIVSLKKNT